MFPHERISKARATKERVPLINARMNGRCLHASGSYNIFCTKIKLNFFVLMHLWLLETIASLDISIFAIICEFCRNNFQRL
jgi:hypothetical protein